jgi:hypothetical protein
MLASCRNATARLLRQIIHVFVTNPPRSRNKPAQYED